MQAVMIISASAVVELPAAGTPSVRGETVQNYYLDLFKNNMQNYRAAIDAAETADDAKKLVMQARKRIQRSFPRPAVKCDLAPRITGEIKHPSGVTVEKVCFKSRENFTVTCNFYRPKGDGKKFPAVVLLAGHSLVGKAAEKYAVAALNLAIKGIAVLAIDPIHQGERIQYTGPNPGLTVGHNIINRHLLVLGENFAQWRVFDAMRGVDYLLSRDDVDGSRIGATGCSGGGTLTSLLAACDERLAAAAPSCYITTFLRNVENELPVDAEQMPYELLLDGGEMADLLLAYAPRPVRILAQEKDFFDVRGARETYEMLKKLYTLLGKPENISLAVGPDGHGMSLHHRQNIYDFFTRTFLSRASSEESITSAIDTEDLKCLPEGGVLQLPGEKSLLQIVNERVKLCAEKRKKYNYTLPEIQTKLRDLLRIAPIKIIPDYRVLRFMVLDSAQPKHIARFAVETEKNMLVTLFSAVGEYHLASQKDALLYLPGAASRDEFASLLPETEKCSVFALDYRGIGELEPNGCDQAPAVRKLDAPYNYDYHFSSLGLLLGKPIIGGRVQDVLSVIELLVSKGAENITLRAAGVSKPVAILAAILSPRPVKLELAGEVISYAQATQQRITPYLQSFIVPGILEVTDLDELLELQNDRFRR